MAGGEEEAGQVGGGQILQRAGLEDHEEVRLEIVPVDCAQAADHRLALLATDAEGELVAKFQLEALRQFALNRHAGQAIATARAGLPPLAFAQGVALGQVGGPGQAQVALYGAIAGGFLADDLLHGLAVDFGQTPGNDRVKRCGFGGKFVQALGEGVFVVGQNVQGEVVRRVLGQLVLPGVEQFGTQQGDQRHGQQDQAEGQGLSGSCQRVA
ncbi:hypothetical protein D3C84_661210 [compost metagenome]